MATTRSEYGKNVFYRNYGDYVAYLIVMLVLCTYAATGFLFYQFTHKPLPLFGAVTTDGRTIPLASYNEPNLMPSTIIRWASKAAVAAYTFNFVDYVNQIELAHPYFTPGGWDAYQSAIQGVINKVVKGQLFVYGVVTNPPVIVNQGPRPGHAYSWHIQVPFLVTYQGAEESKSTNYYVLLTITRVPTTANAESIGVETFEMR